MRIFYSQSSENVRKPLLELFLGRNLLILLSIFPADTLDHNCLIHKEFYMHSLNVDFKNLHSTLLCKKLLVEKTSFSNRAIGWNNQVLKKNLIGTSTWLILCSLTSKMHVFLTKGMLLHKYAIVELMCFLFSCLNLNKPSKSQPYCPLVCSTVMQQKCHKVAQQYSTSSIS